MTGYPRIVAPLRSTPVSPPPDPLLVEYDEGRRLNSLLSGDVMRCLGNMHGGEQGEVQFWRRTFVRAVFADVEAVVFSLRNGCLAAAELTDFALSPAQVTLLQEESFEIDSHGRPKVRPLMTSIERNLRFVFDSFAEVHKLEKVSLGVTGWERFRAAVEIRNRITHPRKLSEVLISDDETSTARQAAIWFNDATHYLHSGALKHIAHEREVLRQKRRSPKNRPT